MKFSRGLIVLSVLGFAVAGQASFELVLVSDRTNKVVNRYDGDSGAFLGSFGGGGFLNAANGLAINQATNTALVLENSGNVLKFNYNTGEYLGFGFRAATASASTNMVRAMDGSLLFWNSGNTSVWRYSQAGVLLNTWNTPAAQNVRWATMGANGLMYAVTSATTMCRFNTSSGTNIGFDGWISYVIAGTSSGFVDAYASPNIAEYWTPTASGAPYATYTGNNIPTATNVSGIGLGHTGNSYYGYTANGTNWTVGRYDYQANAYRGAFGSLGAISGIDVIVAPEPGGLLVLSFAGIGLLRRRK